MFGGHGKRRGCAGTVHVLIRGDLPSGRSEPAMVAGLRLLSKGMDRPPDPKAAQTAHQSATAGVIGQKSAEAIVCAGQRPDRVG